jgi:hypothetical protein
MNTRYLISKANLFYDDQTFYSSENGGGDDPIVVFKSLEEANKEKNRLQAAAVRNLMQKKSLPHYISFGENTPINSSEEVFLDELKEQLKGAEFDLDNDAHVLAHIDALKKAYDLDCANFYYIYELELE